jgi:hypothetical protein
METGSELDNGTDDSGIAASPNAGPPSTDASELESRAKRAGHEHLERMEYVQIIRRLRKQHVAYWCPKNTYKNKQQEFD